MYKILTTISLCIMATSVNTGVVSSPEEDTYQTVLDHIISYESFRAEAYWDVNRYSIGYGTKSYRGEVITKEEARYRMIHEYGKHLVYVINNYNLTKSNAYVIAAFRYNLGSWEDGMEKALQRGDMDSVKEILLLYTKANGKELPGLVRRRIKESKMLN